MIPILLVTGFLGAGKTTFINWLLSRRSDAKISVILNEFGDIQLESHFLKYRSEGVVELANGCMCCVAKSDIPRVVNYILQHSPQTEYIVIEASGLSDPDPVREALQTPPVNISTYLEATVCIIDAVNFEQLRGEHSIITSQIADADLVLISKADEAGEEQTNRVQTLVERLTPDVRVLPLDKSLSPDLFLTSIADPTAHSVVHRQHDHTHQSYQTYLYQATQPFDYPQLTAFLKTLPASVLRIKGVINAQTDQGLTPLRIQRVGARVSVEAMTEQTQLEQSTLLFIGQRLDDSWLKNGLDRSLIADHV